MKRCQWKALDARHKTCNTTADERLEPGNLCRHHAAVLRDAVKQGTPLGKLYGQLKMTAIKAKAAASAAEKAE